MSQALQLAAGQRLTSMDLAEGDGLFVLMSSSSGSQQVDHRWSGRLVACAPSRARRNRHGGLGPLRAATGPAGVDTVHAPGGRRRGPDRLDSEHGVALLGKGAGHSRADSSRVLNVIMPDLPSDRPPALSELNAAGLTSTKQTIRSEPFMGDAA